MQSTKRKLALLVGAALATMAFGASSASAATEVRDAETEELCPAVQPSIKQSESHWFGMVGTSYQYQSGGCSVHVVGEGAVANFEGNAVHCDSEFDLRVGPDGWGYVDNVQYSNCGVYPVTTCSGDRVIAPAEYNPFGIFKYADSATDLNVALCAKVYGSARWGFTSLEVVEYEADPGIQHYLSQHSSPHGEFYHHTGMWQTLVPGGTLLQITH